MMMALVEGDFSCAVSHSLLTSPLARGRRQHVRNRHLTRTVPLTFSLHVTISCKSLVFILRCSVLANTMRALKGDISGYECESKGTKKQEARTS